MKPPVQLYFHAPCFDGVASAAIASEYLSDGGSRSIELHPIGYEARPNWLSRSIGRQAAVVDFLYHPEASFFADHHETSFLNSSARQSFDKRRLSGAEVFYDSASPSCASLLLRVLRQHPNFDVFRFVALARMADTIDSADYRSVEEAVFPLTDEGRLRDSLALNPEPEYLTSLVEAFRREPPAGVARMPLVIERSRRYEELQDAAIRRFRSTLRSGADGLAVFDYHTSIGPVSRYAPYLYAPNARYSLGIIRSREGAKITSMRNPWWNFRSVPLGRIFERFGGGGHERVASLQLPPERSQEADLILGQISAEILTAGKEGARECSIDSTSTISTDSSFQG